MDVPDSFCTWEQITKRIGGRVAGWGFEGSREVEGRSGVG